LGPSAIKSSASLNEKSDPPRSPEGLVPGERAQLGWAALLSGAVFCYAHWQAFTNPFVINDDVRQQLYWMQQWLDPALFRGDLLTDYARCYVPWGVKGLYWLASWVMGPLTFSKVLPGLLLILLGALLFQIGALLAGRRLAWMTAAVYWLMPFFLDNLAGGLARGFAAPSLALLLLCWLQRRPFGMAAALLLQALFIPYIFLVGGAAVLLAWPASRWGRLTTPPFPARPAHFLVLAAGASLVALMRLDYQGAGFGPLVSLADMANRPEFGPLGRFEILPQPSWLLELIRPWEWIAPFRDGGVAAGVLVAPVLAALTLIGAFRVDWRALKSRLTTLGWLGLASLLLYFLARVFLLKLFVPDRYLIYTLNIYYCLLLALCLNAALKAASWPRVLAVLALSAAAALGALRLHNVGLKDYSAYRPLYTALVETPKDALIAGHPNLMDTIPTFARRRAFATYELAHPWSRGYWQQLRPRLDDLFRAYYASDPREIVEFCRKYGISFLVVDDRHFQPDFLEGGVFFFPMETRVPKNFGRSLYERVEAPFFAPFDEEIRRQTAGRSRFALLSATTFRTLYVDQHVRVIDMRPYLNPGP